MRRPPRRALRRARPRRAFLPRPPRAAQSRPDPGGASDFRATEPGFYTGLEPGTKRGRPRRASRAADRPGGHSGRCDLDAPRLQLRLLRNRHLEHALRMLGADRIEVGAVRQGEAAQELAAAALEPPVGAGLFLRARAGARRGCVRTPFSAVISMSFGSTPGTSTNTAKRSGSSCTSTCGIHHAPSEPSASAAENASSRCRCRRLTSDHGS